MKVNVDLAGMVKALEDKSRDTRYFLDRKEGKVLQVSLSGGGLSPEGARLAQQIQADAGRYAQIPRLPSEEGIKDMQAFGESSKDKKLAERISRVIQGGASYREFLDVLEGAPAHKQRWYNFRQERMLLRIKNWLKTVSVEL